MKESGEDAYLSGVLERGADAKAGSVSVTYKGVPPLPDSTMVCHRGGE